MFAYSLTGLEISEDATGGVLEVEESEITARSAVYQVLGQLFAVPDAEFAGKSSSGGWVADFTEAVELLAFDWEIGEAPTDDDLSEDQLGEQYERLFLVEHDGVRRIWGGAYVADREQNLVELRRAYEYYGLGTGNDDVPFDHLTAEVDFMQFLAFKEAAASSPRSGQVLPSCAGRLPRPPARVTGSPSSPTAVRGCGSHAVLRVGDRPPRILRGRRRQVVGRVEQG